MLNMVKKGIFVFEVLLLIFCFNFLIVFAKPVKTIDDKINTLIALRIIDDNINLSENVTRAEFAKMIVRASENRDKVPDSIQGAVCNDVNVDSPYASYIKEVIEMGYMFTFLGGYFKPYECVTFSDLARAALTLLSYTNEDFRGNQVVGRNLKFKSLGLNENIEKTDSELLSKIDVINGIYNTLKEKIKDSDMIYGTKVFDKLIIESDSELNAIEYKPQDLKGPIFVKNYSDFEKEYNIEEFDIYINALKVNASDLKDDIIDYGYAICYVDTINHIIHSYTKREDVKAPISVREGYIYKIYYAAQNMLIPYRVDIDKYKYMIDSEETKFDFSASGKFKEDMRIIYLCNKMNDVSSSYLDSSGKIIYENDEYELYNGSIIVAFAYSLIK